MVTMVLVLIAVLVILRLASAVRDRQMRSTRGVDLARETWEDRMPRPRRYSGGLPWSDRGTSGDSLWYQGGDPGGDFADGGCDGGGGDFGGGDSG
jgi:uncharacterized membrane protein YgcG